MNPSRASIPMDSYTASALAAATSRNPLMASYASGASTSSLSSGYGGINQAAKQLTNELLMAQTTNRSLKQELVVKAHEADDLRLRYYTERNLGVAAIENDRILKESLETLGAKNRAQARELKSLKAQLKKAQESNANKNSNENTSNNNNKQDNKNENENENDNTTAATQENNTLAPTLSIHHEERAKFDTSFLTRCRLIQAKNGCPLCLTHRHTLLNCDVLRSNGFLVTYHSLLDINAHHTAATETSYNYHYSTASVKASIQKQQQQRQQQRQQQQHQHQQQYLLQQQQQQQQQLLHGQFPSTAATAGHQQWGTPKANRKHQAATTITPPTHGHEQGQTIDLLSDSEESDTKEGIREGNDDTNINDHDDDGDDDDDDAKKQSIPDDVDDDDNHVFADIVMSIGGDIDGRGVKHRPITIDFGKEEEEEEERLHQQREKEQEEQKKRIQLQQQQEQERSLVAAASHQNEDSQQYSNNTDVNDGTTNTSVKTNHQQDTEIEIIAETGKNPLSDFAHPRFHCVTKPFAFDPTAFCSNCFCYVCDVRASECQHWNDNQDEDSHCFADSQITKWKRRRSRIRSKRKRPERALKEIEFFLPDTIPTTKLPPKRRTRNPVYDKGCGRSLRQRKRKPKSSTK